MFNAVPASLKTAIVVGIGLFIALIGFKNAGIVVTSEATSVTLGDLHSPTALLALFGLVVTAALAAWKIRGAILIGIVATTLAAWREKRARMIELFRSRGDPAAEQQAREALKGL